MKGYIVGYVSSWADDLVPVVTGYYSGWQKAIDAGKIVEHDNNTRRNSFRKVFIAEIEINKNNIVKNPSKWYESYTYHKIKTVDKKIILEKANGDTVDLGEPSQEANFQTVRHRRRKPVKE